ncbi:neprilysin-like [Chelonus insularis]|uniref:neprilysin-like n=1 Tax=Chelonus insularis TaxID=460826 RepID=UPI0015884F71|nr:neprilysin-like [Chelonus insularis]
MAHSCLSSFYQLIFIAVIIFAFHTSILEAKSILNHEPVCVTKTCKKTADRLLKNMDQNADPCNSFYQYACGNWSDEKQSMTRLMRDNISFKLKELVYAIPSQKNSTVTKLKRFYESCLQIVLEILDKNGGWPLIMIKEEWLSKNKPWQEIDITFRKMIDFSPLFKFDVYISPNIEISPKIYLKTTNADPDEEIFSGDILENFEDFIMLPQAISYKNVINKIAQIFTEHRNVSLADKKLQKNIDDIIKFEWNLEWIKNKTMNEDDGIYKLWINFDDFKSNFSSMNVTTTNGKIDFLNMTEQYFGDHSDFNIPGSQIIFTNYRYFLELVKLLDQTSSEVIANTLHWNFIKTFGPHASKRLFSIVQDLLLPSVRNQPFKLSSRWDICISKTKNFFPHLTAYAYVQKYSSQKIIDENVQMTKRIMEGMTNVINRSSLPHYLKKYWIKSINYSEFLVGMYFLVVLYGILQNPYFDVKQPDVINYGGIGEVIGHEIAHSFYVLKNPYHRNGTERHWFTFSNDTEIRDQIRCVVEKYSNYSILVKNKTHQVNPYKTLQENLADILGVQAGYEAFQICKKNNKESSIRLPGLEHLNSNQLYFLSYASNECSSRNDDLLINSLRDTHTPAIFRIDGALSSSNIFAEAFQCPKGTRMNPEKKCDLSSE